VDFWRRVELKLNYSENGEMKRSKKVIKTACFSSKQAVFLVAGEGFEPTTSGL
jgi:hypothetical protein